MRDDSLRLGDILGAITRIEKYSGAGRVRFDEDELVRVWILHHLEIIGEACAGLSGAFRVALPDEIWRDAVSFRNVLADQYFGIDLEAVWAVVESDLPSLKNKVREIIAEKTDEPTASGGLL